MNRYHEGNAEREDNALLERRILRLEERLDRLEQGGAFSTVHPAWSLALASAAVVFGVLGMGVPVHPYQYLFAVLLHVLAYHRRWIQFAAGGWKWPLAAANFAALALFFRILLGTGVRRPLEWFKLPAIMKNASQNSDLWYGKVLPDYSLQWMNVPGLSDLSIDFTKIQVVLLIAIMVGALFRLQGFSSMAALVLLIVSLPAYLSFTWDWVLLYFVTASVAFYLQSLPGERRRRGGKPGADEKSFTE